VLQDTSGVFGEPPAQHPRRPSDLQSPEEVAKVASCGFSKERPEGFRLKGEGSRVQRKPRKRKATLISRSSNESDSDLDACFAKIAAVQGIECEHEGKVQIGEQVDLVGEVTVPSKDVEDVLASKVEVTVPAGGVVTFPSFIDPFTKCDITWPALSPHGHVCDYDSWIKVLRTPGNENTCPFTKKPIKKDDLVRLTSENIDEFQGKIVNQTAAMKQWRESGLYRSKGTGI